MANAYWIQLDNNARSSIKIKNAALELQELENIPYSTALAVAYADFFRLLEIMDNEGDFIDLNNAFTVRNVADELGLEKEKLLERIKIYIKHNLFDESYLIEENKLGSSGFVARKFEQAKRSKTARENVEKRWSKYRKEQQE